jgi:uncharacterized protein DUF4145
MSERSELLKKVLQTWERSDEGREYLEWLLDPEAADLDGGDILREAVLDVMEDDDQLTKLRSEERAKSMEEFYATLPPEIVPEVRDATDRLDEALFENKNSKRRKAEAVRNIRHVLRCDRIETLKFVSQIRPDEITDFLKKHAVAEELAAKIAALSRTSTGKVDIAADGHRSSLDDSWTDTVQNLATESGESWFDYNREKLDRYYSHQLVAKLDNIVDRASSLAPVSLEVKNQVVSSLFHEAHEAFLYGFDTASIALCRSLVDHALKDKLSVPRGKRPKLVDMIKQAKDEKLLDSAECDSAERVRNAGNDIMHNMSNVQSTAQAVLNCTRIVLNKLYTNNAETLESS